MSLISRRGCKIAALVAVGLLPACGTGSGTGGPSGPTAVPVDPFCSIAITETLDSPLLREVIMSTRTDPAAGNHFTRATTNGSGPRLNPFIANNIDVYGLSEVWLKRPGTPAVIRARSHPSPRPAGDNMASAWALDVQDLSGRWTISPFAKGTANKGDEFDDAPAAAITTPQLMTVGVANPQVFACAGGRTEDNALRTTTLIEVLTPPPASGGTSSTRLIQDMLYGDDRFVPNQLGGPLVGPANPPTPRVHGPGDQAGDGAVLCAMTQLNDDVATRQLHMIARRNGSLYLSVADSFTSTTTESGATFLRFNRVSAWEDVGRALGNTFGTIVSATIVASRPTAVSILFVAQMGTQYRTFHTVRFASGTWRAADDVLALRDGAGAVGALTPFNVAAGSCPMYPETPADRGDEVVYLLWSDNQFASVGRIVSMPRIWAGSGITSIYSPTSQLPGVTRNFPASRNHQLTRISIGARPFSAAPPTP